MPKNKRLEEEHLTEKTSYKSQTGSRSWQFLLVGEHGQIKSVKKFRGLAITAVAVIAVAVIGIAGLGFLYLRAVAHNARLNDHIADVKQQIAAIQAEKEILMARLVIAETKLGEDPQETVAPSAVSDDASAPPKTSSAAVPELKPKQPLAAPPVSQLASPTETGLGVTVEDFKASLDTYQNILTLQYTVRNTKDDGTPVAGHTVLIMKNSNLDIDTWVVLPNVQLEDGRPTGEKGQPFRISRFRVAKFSIEGYAEPSQFDTAVVFVYTKAGELVLEKEFTVQIKVI